MKDINKKYSTLRTATARASLRVSPETIARIKSGDLPKSDPLTVARVAAVQAAKSSSTIIPYCHPLPVDHVGVDFVLDSAEIRITATVKAVAKTGVEMEALTGAAAAALTLYDMIKSIDKSMEILGIRLEEKTGGKSDFRAGPAFHGTAGVLVISDRASSGEREDLTGPLIKEKLEAEGFSVADVSIIPDETETIRDVLGKYINDLRLDLVITTGGTGMGPRDQTPEAVSEFIDRPLPGVAEALRRYGQDRTPYAMLSRTLAGMAGDTVIVALPGSTGAVEDAVSVLFPALVHGMNTMRGHDH